MGQKETHYIAARGTDSLSFVEAANKTRKSSTAFNVGFNFTELQLRHLVLFPVALYGLLVY